MLGACEGAGQAGGRCGPLRRVTSEPKSGKSTGRNSRAKAARPGGEAGGGRKPGAGEGGGRTEEGEPDMRPRCWAWAPCLRGSPERCELDGAELAACQPMGGQVVGPGRVAGYPGSECCVRPHSLLTPFHPSPAKPGWQCLHHRAPGWREACERRGGTGDPQPGAPCICSRWEEEDGARALGALTGELPTASPIFHPKVGRGLTRGLLSFHAGGLICHLPHSPHLF